MQSETRLVTAMATSKPQTVLERSLSLRLKWTQTADLHKPCECTVQNQSWVVRLNNYPDEPLYTLLIDGTPVGDFDDWPQGWSR